MNAYQLGMRNNLARKILETFTLLDPLEFVSLPFES
jgi:hypothetical protein